MGQTHKLGMPVWAIVLVTIVGLLIALVIIRKILQRRAEKRMQDQVKSLLLEYMPMGSFEMETMNSEHGNNLNETLI